MAKQDQSFMKDICLCVSAIAVIEIPLGMWPDFVSLMSSQGCQNDDLFYKKAGIMNLGNIMEALEPSYFQNLEDLGSIWHTMLSNVEGSNLDLTRIVAKSIQKLSPSTPANFVH